MDLLDVESCLAQHPQVCAAAAGTWPAENGAGEFYVPYSCVFTDHSFDRPSIFACMLLYVVNRASQKRMLHHKLHLSSDR